MVSDSKNNKSEVSFFENQESIIEEVYDPIGASKKQFAVFSKAEEKISYTEQLELENGKIIIPIQSSALIDKGVVLLPSRASAYETEEQLVEEIKQFIHTYLDIHPFYENLVTYYVLMTWRFDELSVVPYLRGLGDYGSGKTRLIQTVGSLCYKPMFLAGASSDAYIFRVIELFHGTLVLNELERVGTDLHSQIVIILNNGYEKNLSVGRIEGDVKREPVTFDVFSPKIISTRQRFKDQALESRIISIPMKQTARKDIPPFIDDVFWDKARDIRNKLLYYRFKHFGEMIYREKDLDEKRKKLEFLEPRLRQTLLPIFYVISNSDLEEEFISFAKDYQKQLITDRSSELSGMVFEKLYLLLYESKERISVKQITEDVNKEIQQERAKLSPQRVGRIIRDDLGYKTEKSTGGLFYVVDNQKQTDYLLARFGVESPLTPLNPNPTSDAKVDLVDIEDKQLQEYKSIFGEQTEWVKE